MRGIFDNQKEAGIATDLGITRRTVDTHLERLYRKLDVNTRVALVLRVITVVMRAARWREPGRRSVPPAEAACGAGARVSGKYPTSSIRGCVISEMTKSVQVAEAGGSCGILRCGI